MEATQKQQCNMVPVNEAAVNMQKIHQFIGMQMDPAAVQKSTSHSVNELVKSQYSHSASL